MFEIAKVDNLLCVYMILLLKVRRPRMCACSVRVMRAMVSTRGFEPSTSGGTFPSELAENILGGRSFPGTSATIEAGKHLDISRVFSVMGAYFCLCSGSWAGATDVLCTLGYLSAWLVLGRSGNL